jgi:hypothetical protein
MRYYFAGTESKTRAEWIKEVGAKNSLESAYALRFKRIPNETQFNNFLLDSGGFTLRKNGESIDVGKYVYYINKYDVKFAFNMDTADLTESIENQRVLEAYTNATIIPVYHYSEWIRDDVRELIGEWAEKYKYISIAAIAAPNPTARSRFYEYCFSVVKDKSRIHGLAATKIDDMLNFPFYSVDSTTWINAEKFGEYHEFIDGRIIKHKSLKQEAKLGTNRIQNINLVEYDRKRFFQASAKAYIAFETYVTRLWAERGIVYDQ